MQPAIGSSHDRGTAAVAVAAAVTHCVRLLSIPEVKQSKNDLKF
jgi:hypothetical protein